MDSTCKPPENPRLADAGERPDVIARELQELEDASLRLKDMQQSLQEFLADYYARVGPLLERLETLQDPSASEHDALPEEDATFGESDTALAFSYRAEVKRLYRQLAKACHPDRAEGGAAAYMQVVNHAYRHQNLASLWRLSMKLLPEQPAQLEVRRHAIAEARTSLMESIRVLEESREYQLMQKVFLARLRGQDLIFRIEQDLGQRVDHAERRQRLHQLLAPLKEKPGCLKGNPV